MKLIDDWRRVLLKAWSVRWMLIANGLAALPLLVDGLADYVTPSTALKLTLAANVAGLVSRFIKQDMEKTGA